MESGSSTNVYLNPALSLSIALVKQMEQIRQAQSNMVKQYNEVVSLALKSPYIEIVKNIRDMQNSLAKNLLYALNPFTISNNHTTRSDILEAEVVNNSDQSIEGSISTPTLLPVTTFSDVQLRTRSSLGLSILNNNCVTFKRKKLKGVSLKNAEGRFLINTLLSPNLFTTDEVIFKMFNVSDIRDFSWILRNLKRKFIQNGLEIVFERLWDPNGYSLIDVQYLQ